VELSGLREKTDVLHAGLQEDAAAQVKVPAARDCRVRDR
jgi:hypothetical protein